jgi:predicted lipid-binding transport protein (Tim44 family)
MKRSVALTLVMALVMVLWATDVWARAGGGGTSGSRGTRSYSAPVSPSSPTAPSRPTPPPSSMQSPAPQRPAGLGGLMGGIGGFLLGGLIGSMLFGGLGHGLFGGIGLIEILLVAGLGYIALSFLRRRQQPAPAAPGGYAVPQGSDRSWPPGSTSFATAAAEPPAAPSDLDRGVAHIRRMDGSFDPARFAETTSDAFFKVQGAWTARDMGAVRDLLTPEMYAALQSHCDQLRAERRINRLENIAVRTAQTTEAWQEGGRDFATVWFLASLLDYTTDEAGRVLDGSRAEPVKFEEFWTFVRPVGPNPWRLSAIQQAR